MNATRTETLAMVDGNSPRTIFEKRNGFFISRLLATAILLTFLIILIITGLLIFFTTSCSDTLHCTTECPPQVVYSVTTNSTFTTTEKVVVKTTEVPTPTSNMEPSSTTEEAKQDKVDVRLPRSMVPDSYNVKLVPFIFEGNFTFHGEVKIVINVTKSTNNITLHAEKLTIGSPMILYKISKDSNEKERINLKSYEFDTVRQFMIIYLYKSLVPNQQYVLHIRFVGVLNDLLQGFYRSSYPVGNETRWIAATQFQPTDARRTFPCFDEPALKARFTISIARPKNLTALSNMPLKKTDKPKDTLTEQGLPDYVWDVFEESVPMSTYLVAFVICDFEHINDGKVSVWARRDALSQASYSLKIGPKILNYFETYFRIEFPLPKIDMIALPDFAAGAMENWGLITYRETALLYQDGVSTSHNQQRVATVVSHELAHQWFGNLVTPSWWSDVWLNEGFASYVEYIGVDAVEPSWKVLDQFVVHELQNVLTLDALESSHQISIEVGHPEEINEIFDRISYAKGASIIRMMDYFLTTEVFKKGLTNYLKNRMYSNADQNDLWEALSNQAHKDGVLDKDVFVKQIMDTWTLQTGYPVVTVIRNYNSTEVTLTQERFLLLSNYTKDETLWWIPITVASENDPNFSNTKPIEWMKNEREIKLNDLKIDAEHWLIVNLQETGYYRVNYDHTNWQMLIKYLLDKNNFEKIAATNRAQLIDDSMDLARAGRLNYDTALDVTRYLVHEKDYVPWKAAFVAFGYLEMMLVKTGGYEKFKNYLLSLLDELYKETGFSDRPEDDQLTVFKRVEILHWACLLSHPECIQNSLRQFHNWMSLPDPDNNNPISPNLKNVIYCTALRVGGEDEWNFAWQRYLNTNVGSEKEILMSSMGCTRDMWLLSRYLDRSLTESSGVRKQDTPRVFAAVSMNVIGHKLAFDVVRKEWNRIRSFLGTSLSTINSIIRASTHLMNTEFELKDLEEFAFAHRHEYGTASRTLEQCVEGARANVQWMNTNYKNIVDWLSKVTNR